MVSVRALPNRHRNRAESYHVIYIPPEPQPQVPSEVDLPSPRWWESGNYLTGALFLLVTKIGAFCPSPLIWCTVIAVTVRSCAFGFYPKSEVPGRGRKAAKICDIVGWGSTLLAVALLMGHIKLISCYI